MRKLLAIFSIVTLVGNPIFNIASAQQEGQLRSAPLYAPTNIEVPLEGKLIVPAENDDQPTILNQPTAVPKTSVSPSDVFKKRAVQEFRFSLPFAPEIKTTTPPAPEPEIETRIIEHEITPQCTVPLEIPVQKQCGIDSTSNADQTYTLNWSCQGYEECTITKNGEQFFSVKGDGFFTLPTDKLRYGTKPADAKLDFEIYNGPFRPGFRPAPPQMPIVTPPPTPPVVEPTPVVTPEEGETECPVLTKTIPSGNYDIVGTYISGFFTGGQQRYGFGGYTPTHPGGWDFSGSVKVYGPYQTRQFSGTMALLADQEMTDEEIIDIIGQKAAQSGQLVRTQVFKPNSANVVGQGYYGSGYQAVDPYSLRVVNIPAGTDIYYEDPTCTAASSKKKIPAGIYDFELGQNNTYYGTAYDNHFRLINRPGVQNRDSSGNPLAGYNAYGGYNVTEIVQAIVTRMDSIGAKGSFIDIKDFAFPPNTNNLYALSASAPTNDVGREGKTVKTYRIAVPRGAEYDPKEKVEEPALPADAVTCSTVRGSYAANDVFGINAGCKFREPKKDANGQLQIIKECDGTPVARVVIPQKNCIFDEAAYANEGQNALGIRPWFCFDKEPMCSTKLTARAPSGNEKITITSPTAGSEFGYRDDRFHAKYSVRGVNFNWELSGLYPNEDYRVILRDVAEVVPRPDEYSDRAEVVITSPQDGQVFTLGQPVHIAWKGGREAVKLGLGVSGFVARAGSISSTGTGVPTDYQRGIIREMGWLKVNAAPNGTYNWDGKTICDATGGHCYDMTTQFPITSCDVNGLCQTRIGSISYPAKLQLFAVSKGGYTFCISDPDGGACNVDWAEFTIEKTAGEVPREKAPYEIGNFRKDVTSSNFPVGSGYIVGPGKHTIEARVVDVTGRVVATDKVVVYGIPASFEITEPAAGAVINVNQPLTVKWTQRGYDPDQALVATRGYASAYGAIPLTIGNSSNYQIEMTNPWINYDYFPGYHIKAQPADSQRFYVVSSAKYGDSQATINLGTDTRQVNPLNPATVLTTGVKEYIQSGKALNHVWIGSPGLRNGHVTTPMKIVGPVTSAASSDNTMAGQPTGLLASLADTLARFLKAPVGEGMAVGAPTIVESTEQLLFAQLAPLSGAPAEESCSGTTQVPALIEDPPVAVAPTPVASTPIIQESIKEPAQLKLGSAIWYGNQDARSVTLPLQSSVTKASLGQVGRSFLGRDPIIETLPAGHVTLTDLPEGAARLRLALNVQEGGPTLLKGEEKFRLQYGVATGHAKETLTSTSASTASYTQQGFMAIHLPMIARSYQTGFRTFSSSNNSFTSTTNFMGSQSCSIPDDEWQDVGSGSVVFNDNPNVKNGAVPIQNFNGPDGSPQTYVDATGAFTTANSDVTNKPALFDFSVRIAPFSASASERQRVKDADKYATGSWILKQSYVDYLCFRIIKDNGTVLTGPHPIVWGSEF